MVIDDNTRESTAPHPGRIVAIHRLRAVAALCVVANHFGQFFWAYPALALAIAGVPAGGELQAPPLFQWVSSFPLDLGAFGVALFFLISGYVIPPAAARARPLRFLGARVLRIGPVWMLALLFSLLVIYMASGGHRYDLARVLSNLLLVRDLAGEKLINPVVWSLEVEVKYYGLAALVALACGTDGAKTLRAYTVGAVLLLAAAPLLQALSPSEMLRETGYLHLSSFALIFCGTAIAALRGRGAPVRGARLLLATSVFAWGIASLVLGNATSRVSNLSAHALAFVVFVLVLRYQHRLWRESGLSATVLDWLADRSYPLYAVHVIPGFALIGVMGSRYASPVLGVVLALIVAVSLAAALHVWVERPAMRLHARASGRVTP